VRSEPLALEESPHKGKAGLRRIANAAGYSLGVERAVMIGVVVSALIIELLNAAVEAAVWLLIILS
jgi:diacylglycerol kinase